MNLSYEEWKADELKEFLKGTTWRVAVNDKGKTYYYHKVKKISQWVKPDDIKEFEDTLTQELFLAHKKNIELESSGYEDPLSAISVTALEPAAKNSASPALQKATPVKAKAPRVLTKAELEQIIERKDSILEPNAVSTAKALIQDHHASPEDIVQKLANSYSGFPAMSRMLVEWIQLAKILELKQSAVHLNTTSLAHYGSAFYGEEVLSAHVADLLKLRFNRKGADSLVTQPDDAKSLPVVPAYVHTLLQNDNYKAALQELYTVHDQSALLQAVCSGKYTTPMSTDIDDNTGSMNGTDSSSTAGVVVGTHSAYEVLVGEVKLFQQVQALLDEAAQEVGSAATAQDKLVRLVAASSETVKEYTLQLLSSSIQLLGALKKDGDGAGSVDGGGTTGAGGDSRKRSREEEDGAANVGDGSNGDNKRMRRSAGGSSRNWGDMLAALSALHHTILHTTSSGGGGSASEASGRVLLEDEEVCAAVERVVGTQRISAEDAEVLSNHFVRSGSDPSASVVLLHPSLLRVLVSAYHHLLLLHPDSSASLQKNLCGLLGRSAFLHKKTSSASVGAALVGENILSLVQCMDMVEETHGICQQVQETFYGVIPEDAVAHLKEQLVVRSPVCAALAVHFAAQHTARSSANARNTDFVGVLPVLCGVVQSAVDAHPAVHAQCLAAAKSIIACAGSILKAGEREDAAKVSVLTSEVGVAQRLVLDLCVKLISCAYTRHTLQFLVSAVADLDIEMVRYVLHGLLGLPERLTLFSSLPAATLLVELLHSDICLRAISSEHFGPAGRGSLGVLIERISALEGLDDKTRRKCADLSSVARQ